MARERWIDVSGPLFDPSHNLSLQGKCSNPIYFHRRGTDQNGIHGSSLSVELERCPLPSAMLSGKDLPGQQMSSVCVGRERYAGSLNRCHSHMALRVGLLYHRSNRRMALHWYCLVAVVPISEIRGLATGGFAQRQQGVSLFLQDVSPLMRVSMESLRVDMRFGRLTSHRIAHMSWWDTVPWFHGELICESFDEEVVE